MAKKPKQKGGSLGSFLDDPADGPYTETVSTEIRLRILLTMAAYAYEFRNEEIISDGDFDELSKAVDLTVNTQRPDLDKFFREKFIPDSGMWIRSHPELAKVEALYDAHYNPNLKRSKKRKKK